MAEKERKNERIIEVAELKKASAEPMKVKSAPWKPVLPSSSSSQSEGGNKSGN